MQDGVVVKMLCFIFKCALASGFRAHTVHVSFYSSRISLVNCFQGSNYTYRKLKIKARMVSASSC